MGKLALGLDFGTSNTTAALYDGKNIIYIPLEEGADKDIMATALYLDRSFQPTVGKKAIDISLEANRGRQIILEDKEVGVLQIHMGEMDRDHYQERDRTYTTVVTGKIDGSMPGRLFRSMKSYLGDDSGRRFDVFGKRFTLEAILTVIIRHIMKKIEEETGGIELNITIGRPVLYGGSSKDPNGKAILRMRQICRNGGAGDVSFLTEPQAAALSYLAGNDLKGEENLLVFDFGGGTLDLCLLHRKDKEFKILALGGVSQAGDRIDRLIYRNKIFPLLGDGLAEEYDFHFSDFEEKLLNWQGTYLLNEPSYMERVNHLISKGGEGREAGIRLKKLIKSNNSFSLLRKVEKGKIDLSSMEDTIISLDEIELAVPFNRSEFESWLTPVFKEIEDVVASVLLEGAIDNYQVGRVICTGGSSKIPAVRRKLAELLGREPQEWDSFRGIAAGLALHSYGLWT